jgi:dTMP kinase
MEGKLIVIDGTDGAGKKTQSERITVLLRERGYNAVRIEFPQYGKRSATLVEDYLNGKFGSVHDVTPHQASIFYACDRYAGSFELRELLAQGTIVICDRYTSANMGHQTGKITGQAEREAFLQWLDHLEFTIFGIPRPHKNILLYMPPHIGQRLVDQKGLREYIGGAKRDIHEQDLTHLEKSAEAFLWVAKKYNWHIIHCAKGEEIRSRDEIAHEILSLIEPILQ